MTGRQRAIDMPLTRFDGSWRALRLLNCATHQFDSSAGGVRLHPASDASLRRFVIRAPLYLTQSQGDQVGRGSGGLFSDATSRPKCKGSNES
jgi:hypothetical protein